METVFSVCETALVVFGVGDVQRQLDILLLRVERVRRVAGALGVGGGLGLDGLGRVLGLVLDRSDRCRLHNRLIIDVFLMIC